MNLASALHFPVGLPSLASFAVLRPSLHSLCRWLAGNSAGEVRPMQRHSLRQLPIMATRSVASRTSSIKERFRFDHTKSPNRPPARPALRVLRIHEANQAPATVGRMVISGRMADVCAELDRLALQETQGLAAPSR